MKTKPQNENIAIGERAAGRQHVFTAGDGMDTGGKLLDIVSQMQ
jgi:hypothetical protein